MKRSNPEETIVPQSEIPTAGPALLFEAEGDVAQALIEALVDEAHCLGREPESMVFVVEGGRSCRLVFTEPAPMPLVRAMIKRLGGGTLRPVRLERFPLRPLLRLNELGFALFVAPVLAGAQA